jgi:hypothetical protein
MEDENRLVAEINAIKIKKEELWQLAADSEEYHRENPDAEGGFEAGLSMIARRVKKGDFRRVHALWCRMNAVAKIVDAGGAPGWTLPKLPDGSVPTMEAVFTAAAEHPLFEREGEIVFDRTLFLDRVLEVAEPEGTA